MDTVAQKQHFDKLLEVFGSYKDIAEKLGMKYVTIYAWSMRNSIPKKHHKASYRDWETDRKSTRLNSSHRL